MVVGLSLPVGDRDHVRGRASAPVTLVEYGDYDCSCCGDAEEVVGRLLKELGDEVRFVFRHLPLSSLHPHAQRAAEAAEAAAGLGRFWEMHDWLFGHPHQRSEPELYGAAADLGVDPSAFAKALLSDGPRIRVQEDFRSGLHSGANGTPTFYVNGIRHEGDGTYEELLTEILASLRP